SLPFKDLYQASIMYAVMQGRLDFSKLTLAEQTVIRKATDRDPEKRYASALELVKALRQAVEGSASKPSGSKSHKVIDILTAGLELVPGYRLVRPLGRGGYGTVWEATAPGGKSVALKVIRNLDAATGKQEFKALELIKGVDHNHLLELQAYWLLDKEGE